MICGGRSDDPVWRSGENFSPRPWSAPPPFGKEIAAVELLLCIAQDSSLRKEVGFDLES